MVSQGPTSCSMSAISFRAVETLNDWICTPQELPAVNSRVALWIRSSAGLALVAKTLPQPV